MPYFLVRGVLGDSGKDCVVVELARDAEAARRASNAKHVCVSSVVALDAGEQDGMVDARGVSAMMRLGTRLDQGGRTDEAILMMHLVLESEAEGEAAVRVARYLRRAGRNDEAWRHLNAMKVAGYRGHSIEAFGAHTLSEVFREMSRVLDSENKHKECQLYGCIAEAIDTVILARGSFFRYGQNEWYEVIPEELRDLTVQATDVLAPLLGTRRLARKIASKLLKRRKREPHSWAIRRALETEAIVRDALNAL